VLFRTTLIKLNEVEKTKETYFPLKIFSAMCTFTFYTKLKTLKTKCTTIKTLFLKTLDNL